MDITVEIKDQDVKRLFNRLSSAVRDLTPAMREIGEIVRTSVIRNFEAGGRPERWKPHAAATIMRGISRRQFTKGGRLRAGSSRRLARGKVLIDTGRLQGSIAPKPYSDKVIVGTNVKYARIHQLGGKAGRGRKVAIPARPYLMVQDEDWGPIKEAILRRIEEASRK